MKMIQVKTQAEAVSELLAYGSPVNGYGHSIIESDIDGGFTVLINHPLDFDVAGEGVTYTHDDVTLAVSEAIGDGTLDYAPIKTRIDIMFNR